eukprot:8261869-Alexandrium_andersonii.AAC.1
MTPCAHARCRAPYSCRPCWCMGHVTTYHAAMRSYSGFVNGGMIQMPLQLSCSAAVHAFT